MTNELLIINQIKQKHPDEWLLVTDCRLSKYTDLEAGKVVGHSRIRDDVHKAPKHYTRKLPYTMQVRFPMIW